MTSPTSGDHHLVVARQSVDRGNDSIANRLLIVGVPRSGTTWLARVLGACEETAVLTEPDNALKFPFAVRKRSAAGGYYPALAPGDAHKTMERLWAAALGEPWRRETRPEKLRRHAAQALFRKVTEQQIRAAFMMSPHLAPRLRLAALLAVPARPQPARNLVVKTVQAARLMEWLGARTSAQVILSRRDLRNVISSWLELGWVEEGSRNALEVSDLSSLLQVAQSLGVPAPPPDPLERTSWLIGILQRSLDEAASRNPDWVVVSHEELCVDPAAKFPALAAQIGLEWSSRAEQVLAANDRPGAGDTMQRVAAGSQDIWRRRLTPAQATAVTRVLDSVGVLP
jgi:hypothetical protein